MTDTMLTFDGITQSIAEWALDYGIYPKVITDRLARGWTTERAITAPMACTAKQRLFADHMPGLPRITLRRKRPARPRKARGKRLTFDGKCHTISEWSELTGISHGVIHWRLKSGWSVENALTLKKYAKPGVVQNLQALEGTGGGSLAQDIPEIEIFQ